MQNVATHHKHTPDQALHKMFLATGGESWGGGEGGGSNFSWKPYHWSSSWGGGRGVPSLSNIPPSLRPIFFFFFSFHPARQLAIKNDTSSVNSGRWTALYRFKHVLGHCSVYPIRFLRVQCSHIIIIGRKWQ